MTHNEGHVDETPIAQGAGPADGAPSRRRMLKLAGAAAAGAAAAAAMRDGRASALDPNDVALNTTNAATASTVISYGGAAAPVNNIFTAQDALVSTGFPSAVGGIASGVRVQVGVHGFSAGTVAGVVGHAEGSNAVGVLAKGSGRANVLLTAEGAAGPARAAAHVAGEIVCDAAGDLWFCASGGSPGSWRKLAGVATAGAYHAIVPSRVHDSRVGTPAPGGALAVGNNRLVSLRDRRALDTGAVLTADIVPAGATAVTANVTVVDTVGSGFLTINPGGNLTVAAATINWTEAGQILNNGVNLTLSALREVTVIAGGVGDLLDAVRDRRHRLLPVSATPSSSAESSAWSSSSKEIAGVGGVTLRVNEAGDPANPVHRWGRRGPRPSSRWSSHPTPWPWPGSTPRPTWCGTDGHSDYGHAFQAFWERWGREITPATSVVILGDARNNYHQANAWVLDEVRKKARRLYWLNPEPRSYWDTGDSVASLYGAHCDGVFECRNLRQLEQFVAEVG